MNRRTLFSTLAAPFAFLGGWKPRAAATKLPTGRDILKSFDATVWARAFVAIAKASPTTIRLNSGAGELYIPLPDEGWMTTWFANALMRGYDEYRWRQERKAKPASAVRYTVPPRFWYENDEGQRWIPNEKHRQEMTEPPAGFHYHHSQFPNELHSSCATRWGAISSSASWNEDLVLAMANDGYKLGEAILIVATMCERCTNAAVHDYGLTNNVGLTRGYARYSERWERANTRCEYCDGRAAGMTTSPEICQTGCAA